MLIWPPKLICIMIQLCKTGLSLLDSFQNPKGTENRFSTCLEKSHELIPFLSNVLQSSSWTALRDGNCTSTYNLLRFLRSPRAVWYITWVCSEYLIIASVLMCVSARVRTVGLWVYHICVWFKTWWMQAKSKLDIIISVVTSLIHSTEPRLQKAPHRPKYPC